MSKNFDTETLILFITGTSSMMDAQPLKIGAQGLIGKESNSFLGDSENKVEQLLEAYPTPDLRIFLRKFSTPLDN